jgi:predicted MFS family arabinose efflux permease
VSGRPRWILPVIVVSQLCGTSLWFAGNAVLGDLVRAWGSGPGAVAALTSAVQAGFIAGTLLSAGVSLADRVSPRRLFLLASLLGAGANLIILAAPASRDLGLASRFLTGVCLGGIYPVGMKIAAGWYREGLGRAIGYLVGALVVGTALPHLIRGAGAALPWQAVIGTTSAVAALGGLLMFALVPDGPHHGPPPAGHGGALREILAARAYRASALGYFGHMWELYAFWAFVPVALAARGFEGPAVPLAAFAVIAAGSVGCVLGGIVAARDDRTGSARVAALQLAASGACCLASPLVFQAPPAVFLGFLVLWGVVVVGDSPQFSALNARGAPPGRVGTALTLANGVGFAITMASLWLLGRVAATLPPAWLFVFLAPGPVLGLIAMRPLLRPGPDGER